MKRITILLTLITTVCFSNILGQSNNILTHPDSTITYFYAENGDSTPLTKTVYLKVNDKSTALPLINRNDTWYSANIKTNHSSNSSSFEFNYVWLNNTWAPTDYKVKEFIDELVIIENEYNFDFESESWLCNSETNYFYNNQEAIDSVLFYYYDFKSNSLVLLNKEIRTNSYNLPVYACYYEYSNNNWCIKGKTEYQYNEENHDIIEKYYTYNNTFELRQKTYTDKDKNGKILKSEVYAWQNDLKEWTLLMPEENNNATLFSKTIFF